MANKTVYLKLPSYSGTSGLTLILTAQSSITIANGSGDTLTAGSNGLFSCTVTEAITGWFDVEVRQSSLTIAEGGKLYIGSDTAGDYFVDDPGVTAELVADQMVALPVYGSVVGTVSATNISVAVGSTTNVSVSTSQDLSAKTLRIVAEDNLGADVFTISDGSITKTSTSIGFAISNTHTGTVREMNWSCRDASTDQVYLQGKIDVYYAAR